MSRRLHRALATVAQSSPQPQLPRCRSCGARLTWGLFGGLLRPCSCSARRFARVEILDHFTELKRST